MFDNSVIDILEEELNELGWKYKDNGKELILLCPYCLREGKEKLKLYISKSEGLYHCFRCGKSGHLYNLKLLHDLSAYRTIDYINQDIDLDKLSRQIIKQRDINEELQFFKENKDEVLKKVLKLAKDNIRKYLDCTSKEETKFKSIALSYLLNRNISPYILNSIGIRYYICDNSKSNLFGRILFPTYFYTSYEARAFIDTDIRYIRTRSNFPDFVFFNMHKGRFIPLQDLIQLDENNKINHKYLIITEGLFDSLRLVQYNIPTVSMGGKANTIRVLKFLYILQQWFNIEFGKLIFVFDNDVKKEEIEEFHNYYIFDLKEIFGFDIETYKMIDYKDISEIPDNKIEEYIAKLTK